MWCATTARIGFGKTNYVPTPDAANVATGGPQHVQESAKARVKADLNELKTAGDPAPKIFLTDHQGFKSSSRSRKPCPHRLPMRS